jgi:SAM-dependent methyltransferase
MNLRQEGCWDQHYEEELKNFHDNGDEGDVWFGEPLTRKIVNRILQEISDNKTTSESNSDIRILDVGCGNAFLLCTLAEKAAQQLPDSTSNRLKLFGIDYSANAIELSKNVVSSKQQEHLIHLQQCDFLDTTQVREFSQEQAFDFIVDKGTYDAICLLSNNTDDLVKQRYKQSVSAISKTGTIFILASCNHTEDELLSLFNEDGIAPDQPRYRLLRRIETPKIKFGGKEGSQVCCLVLKFN